MFPTIARIPDSMLQKVDPSHLVLVTYLKTINPSIEIGVLLPKNVRGPSKKRRGSKKDVRDSLSKSSPEQIEKAKKHTPKKIVKSDPPPKKVVQPIGEETSTHEKETMPSKSGVLK